MPEVKTYRANCHCKKHVFEFQCPEIKSGYECNCSSCHKRGGISNYVDNVNWVKGHFDTLTSFTFPNANFELQFCPTCGNNLFAYGNMTPGKPPVRAVNLLMVQDLNVSQLEKKFVDGASLPTKYETPRYQGEDPTAEIEGESRVYTGGCFCGDITLALKCQPLDADFPEKIVSCNCSHCSRIEALWVYIKRDQIRIHGRENMTLYQMGQLPIKKTFCRRCGCNLTNEHLNLTEDECKEAAGGDEMMRLGLLRMTHSAPFNLRTLDRDSGGDGGFDMARLKVQEWTQGKDMGTPYVNP